MTSEMKLENRVALVTGAGSGLGRAMAVGLLRHGAKVVLTGRNSAALEETVGLSGTNSNFARIVPADLLKPADVQKIVLAGKAAFGRVDVLVNNAGIMLDYIRSDFRDKPIRYWEVTPQNLRDYFEINAIAPNELAAQLTPDMITRGWGRIINVTTSLNTMLKQLGYGGSKAALEAHTATMANDLVGTGVTANVLIPGGRAATRLTPNTKNVSAMVPPEAMVPPLVWLSSSESDGVNGRRFNASRWDAKMPDAEAAEISGSDVAWTGFGDQARPM